MAEDANTKTVTVRVGAGSISLARGDITTFAGDAIVNAANPGLLGGGGVDGAIHRAAGRDLYDECKAIVERRGPLPPGQAVITGAGHLLARHVIHTVGPVWRGGSSDEAGTLASAYRESLMLAVGHGIESVAFPSISTGAYGYPVHEAAHVALGTVHGLLADPTEDGRGLDVTFVLYDERTYRAYDGALAELRA